MFGKDKIVYKDRPRRLYVIYNKISEDSGPVYEALNDAIACRNFHNAIAKAPFQDDFKLLLVGEIDHQTSVITPVVPPVEVMMATDEAAIEDGNYEGGALE